MNKININVSGKGQVHARNVVQGRDVSISGDGTVTSNGTALLKELLEAVRKAAGEAAKETLVAGAEGDVKELAEAVTAEPNNAERIKGVLKVIKEHHDWAFPAIAAVVKKVVPTVAALL